MGSNDILKCIVYGAEWLTLGGLAYIGALAGTQTYSDRKSRRIESRQELEMIVDEEARKLGLDPESIEVMHDAKISLTKKEGDKYRIRLSNTGKNRSTVRHELCHIKKDVDKMQNYNLLKHLFFYFFIAEPRATLYGLGGIDRFAKDKK